MSARKLIIHMSMSLDGFVAQADGRLDFMSSDAPIDHGAQRHRINLEMIGQTGAIVMGSGGYSEMSRGWAPSDSPMAKLINGLPKIVFSASLEDVEYWPNSRLTRRPIGDEIPELKAQEGRDIIVFGGGRIAHSLIREQLADELRLTVHPVALGDGLPLFHGLPEPQRFELVSATTYTDGSILQVLRPA